MTQRKVLGFSSSTFMKTENAGLTLLHVNVDMNTVGVVYLFSPGTLSVSRLRHSSLCQFSIVFRKEYLGGNMEGRYIKMGFISTINSFLFDYQLSCSLFIMYLSLYSYRRIRETK